MGCSERNGAKFLPLGDRELFFHRGPMRTGLVFNHEWVWPVKLADRTGPRQPAIYPPTEELLVRLALKVAASGLSAVISRRFRLKHDGLRLRR